MSFGAEAGTPMDTLRARKWPSIRQFSVFMENRVGQLLEVVRLFEGTKVRIVALSIVNAVECAVVRLVLSHPEQGRELLEQGKYAFAESDLVGVQLPPVVQPILQVCTALLQAEINIHYAYPMLVHPRGRAALALQVDNTETAIQILNQRGFTVLTEADLADDT